MHQSPDDAARLRQNVTSPGGTTAAALSVLMAEDAMQPLFDLIVGYLPGPAVDAGQPTQFQCNNLDYNDYVGRLGIGRLKHGTLESGATYVLCTPDGKQRPVKIVQLLTWRRRRQAYDLSPA